MCLTPLNTIVYMSVHAVTEWQNRINTIYIEEMHISWLCNKLQTHGTVCVCVCVCVCACVRMCACEHVCVCMYVCYNDLQAAGTCN